VGVLLDNGRYQVLENLFSETGYTASVCIDVETRTNYKPLLINIYSDPNYISFFLPLFYNISKDMCENYHHVISGNRCIMAVFDYHQGVPLQNYLESLPKSDYPARAQAVGNLLDAALILDTLPLVFACSALRPPNTVFYAKENTVRFNFIIKPDGNKSDEEEKLAMFTAYLESAFIKNRFLPAKAAEFLEQVRSGKVSGFVHICSAWRGISASAMAEYETYIQESIFGYVRRLFKKKAKGRKNGA